MLASAPHVLTIDIGTSSTRCSLHDARGERCRGRTAQRFHVPRASEPGAAELDPRALLREVVDCVDDVLAPTDEIAVVAMGGVSHSLLGLDASGEPTSPVYLWRDARSALDAAALRSAFDEREVHARTGCRLHFSYWPAKLAWLRRTRPALFERTRRWVSLPDHVRLVLAGYGPSSVSMAAGTGLLDQERIEWDEELLGHLELDVGRMLPIVRGGEDLSRPIGPARWSQLSGAPWLAPEGDGALSNIGAGCIGPTRAALMVGTSVAFRVLHAPPRFDVPFGIFGYRLGERRLCLGGAMNDGGGLVAWMMEHLRVPDGNALEAALGSRGPGAHGLVLVPQWGGERSPDWSLHGSGAVAGLGYHHGGVDLVHAAMEAIALSCSEVAERVRAAVPGLQEIVVTGRALLSSPAWTRIMADALGHPLFVSMEPEASSRGAALLALERLGELDIEDADARLGAVIEPDLARHRRYREAAEEQRALAHAIAEARGRT